ncbi:MAG: hypothetical protein ACK4QP_10300 [Pseudorhizobium sp.]
MKIGSLPQRALIGSFLLASASLSAPALAATDGTLGATSTGTVSITASVPSRVRISGLTDIDFTNQDPATAASSAQNVCVWSNTATKAYTITATGSGAGSAFTLSNGSAAVSYEVQWAGISGAMAGTTLTAGSASSSFSSTATNQNCASGPSASASLIVGLGTGALSAMNAGANYTGTLTLLVTPL